MLLLSEPKAPGGFTVATGQAGTFTDVLDASWESTRYAWNANSRWRALEEAYDRRIAAVKDATGQTLDNPLRAVPTADDYREIAKRTKASGKAIFLPDYMDEKFQGQIARIAESNPDKLGVLRPHVRTVQDAVDIAQGAERKLSDVLSRTSGLTGTLANLAGGVGASFEDPATYALAPIGLSGSASKSLLWNALRAAASNAGAQAITEPFIQQWRAEAGLEAGLVPGLQDIAFAGAVGGGLDFLVRGTVRGAKLATGAGVAPPPAMERGATIEDAIPRLPEDNLVARAAKGDDAALVTAAQKIEGHLTTAQRGALRALEDETGLKIDAGEDLAAVAQAIRHAEDPIAEPLPVHEPDPAPVAPAKTDAAPAAPDAPADDVATRLAEGRGSAIETAAAFRARPELIASTPLEGKARTARSLARLSEPAFEMVQQQGVKPQWGALVADHVVDPAEHVDVLRKLAEARPETAAEARRIIAQETLKPATPKAAETALGGGTPTPVERTLHQVAHAIQSGAVPEKRAREALKRRIESGELDTSAGPEPAPRGLDEPAGAEAKAEVEAKLKERKSRLGKGLKQIEGEQKGGQAAVDRVAGRGGKQGPMFSLTAWHGSAKNFERFSTEYLRSGEGAMSFGRGLYFTETKAVAESYRKALGAKGWDTDAPVPHLDGKPIQDNHEMIAASYLEGSDYDGAIREMSDSVDYYRKELALAQKKPSLAERLRLKSPVERLPEEFWRRSLKERDDALALIERMRDEGKTFEHKRPGADARLYKVNINADEADLIKFDRPLAEQPDAVKAILGKDGGAIWDGDTAEGRLPYRKRAGLLNSPDIVDALIIAGVKGVKYLDKLSRAKGDGSYNFVVFDAAHVAIEQKHALFSLSPAAAAAMPDVRVKLNEIAATLPKAVRIRLYDRLTFADLPEHIQRTAPPGVEQRTINGLWDPEQMVIHLALSTADPVATLRHEQVHMMRALGLLSDADYRRLVRHAEKIDARKTYKIDATYGATIKAQQADKVAREAVLVEESVAHLVADRLAGKTIGGGLDKVLKPIRDFLRKIRDALGLKGFRTVEDVFRTVERGGDGGKASGDLMFSLSPDDAEAALGVRLGEAELRGKVGAAARKLAGNVEMQASWIEGMGLEAGDAEEIVKLYHGFLKDFRQIMDDSTAKRLARDKVADLLETEATQRKRVALLQLEATTRAREVLSTHKNARGEVDPAQAMIGTLEHYGLEGTPITSSVEGRRKAILGRAHAQMEELLWNFRKTGFTGRRMNRAQMGNVVRELFGEDSGDPAAKALAKAWSGPTEELRQRFNQAGGAVGKLEKWGLPQIHDARALKKRGLAQWKADTLALLDPAKMRHPLTGEPMTAAQVAESLDVVFKRIVTDGLFDAPDTTGGGRGALYKQHAEHRFLVFKDADAWLKYQREYGTGGPEGIFGAMMNHVNVMARDIAAMEVLGPNPGLTLEAMIGFVRKEGTNAAGGQPALFPTKSPKGLPWDPAAYTAGAIRRARDMWSHMHGEANVPVNGFLANTLSAVRNITFGTSLGSATLSSLSDLGRQQIHRRFAGVFKRAHGESPLGVVGDLVQQFKSLNRREAVRSGLILESAMHVLHANARYAGSFNGPMWSQVVADRMLTWGLLTPWTQANRHVFGLSIMAEVADNVGKRFEALDPALQRFFGRYGMGAAEWDAIRQFEASVMGDAETFLQGREPASGLDPKDRRGGKAGALVTGKAPAADLDPIRYLKPSDIKDTRLAERYLEMILQETERAVPSGTVANKALWVGPNQPGTMRGELLRTVSMLKSYGTIVLMQDWGRFASEIAQGRPLRGARFMAAIAISSTVLGALAMQLKSLSRGEDPRPMDDPNFWGAALLQGGGLGIYGDYLFGSVNRFGGGFAGSLAGPVTSRASNLWNLTGGNLIQLAQDEPTNFGREATSFLRMNLSLPFYARLAYERILLDELQKSVDPQARAAFRRKASKLKTQFKTGYWWAPGESAPARAPDFANALGN